MTGVTNHLSDQAAWRPGVGLGAGVSGLGRGVGHFSEVLNPGDAATERVKPGEKRAAREAAEKLVSITLVEPILKQVREDPLRSELFHGGAVEGAFGPQLDSILAERVTGVSGFSIVETVYRRVFERGAGVSVHG